MQKSENIRVRSQIEAIEEEGRRGGGGWRHGRAIALHLHFRLCRRIAYSQVEGVDLLFPYFVHLVAFFLLHKFTLQKIITLLFELFAQEQENREEMCARWRISLNYIALKSIYPSNAYSLLGIAECIRMEINLHWIVCEACSKIQLKW